MNPEPTHIYHDPVYGPHLREAYRYARRFGLGADDSEDCAMSFLAYKLSHRKSFAQDSALRKRCAHDFACNMSRSHTTHAKHEEPISNFLVDEDKIGAWEPVDCQPSPAQEMARRAFWDLLLSYFDKLQPVPRDVMRRHHMDGETIGDVASALGKTPPAVGQILYRAHQRLLILLTRDGVCIADLLDHLTIIG